MLNGARCRTEYIRAVCGTYYVWPSQFCAIIISYLLKLRTASIVIFKKHCWNSKRHSHAHTHIHVKLIVGTRINTYAHTHHYAVVQRSSTISIYSLVFSEIWSWQAWQGTFHTSLSNPLWHFRRFIVMLWSTHTHAHSYAHTLIGHMIFVICFQLLPKTINTLF